MLVSAHAFHGADIVGIDRGCDFVAVHLKVSHIAGGTLHLEAEGLAFRNHNAVLRPVQEVVTRVGRGRQGAGREVEVNAVTFNGTAVSGIGRGGDVVALQHEVGHKLGILSQVESVVRISGNHLAVLRPVREVVAHIRLSVQRADGVVHDRTCGQASVNGINRDSDHGHSVEGIGLRRIAIAVVKLKHKLMLAHSQRADIHEENAIAHLARLNGVVVLVEPAVVLHSGFGVFHRNLHEQVALGR